MPAAKQGVLRLTYHTCTANPRALTSTVGVMKLSPRARRGLNPRHLPSEDSVLPLNYERNNASLADQTSMCQDGS
jgi:hypothetical protein